MLDRSYDIGLRLFTGGNVTDEERQYMRTRNTKYEIVRYVYMEKMKHEGRELADFHFTPGDGWMDIPILDIVNGLMKVSNIVKNNIRFGDSRVTPLDFSDLRWKENSPPDTGKAKTSLSGRASIED